MWGDVGRCGEMSGDVGRYREMWGDMELLSASRRPRPGRPSACPLPAAAPWSTARRSRSWRPSSGHRTRAVSRRQSGRPTSRPLGSSPPPCLRTTRAPSARSRASTRSGIPAAARPRQRRLREERRRRVRTAQTGSTAPARVPRLHSPVPRPQQRPPRLPPPAARDPLCAHPPRGEAASPAARAAARRSSSPFLPPGSPFLPPGSPLLPLLPPGSRRVSLSCAHSPSHPPPTPACWRAAATRHRSPQRRPASSTPSTRQVPTRRSRPGEQTR